MYMYVQFYIASTIKQLTPLLSKTTVKPASNFPSTKLGHFHIWHKILSSQKIHIHKNKKVF